MKGDRKTNRRDEAAALRYDPAADAAPRVVASGTGALARKIVALAEATAFPSTATPDLVALLLSVEPGEAVPPELYPAVAEVLVWVYRTSGAEPPVFAPRA